MDAQLLHTQRMQPSSNSNENRLTQSEKLGHSIAVVKAAGHSLSLLHITYIECHENF